MLQAVNAFLQAEYGDYVHLVPVIHTWFVALGWLSFGTLAACAVFWHMGTPIPSLGNQVIIKSECSTFALACAILCLVALSAPFGILLVSVR